MLQGRDWKRWRDTAAAVVLGILLSRLGFMFFLFIVPLYVLYYKKGFPELVLADAVVVASVFASALWNTRMVESAEFRTALLVLEMAVPVLLSLGLFFVIDIIPGLKGFRRLYRLFAATAAAAIVVYPLYLYLKGNEEFVVTITEHIRALTGVFTGESGRSFDSEVMSTYLDQDSILEFIGTFYINTVAAVYFVMLSSAVRVGDAFVCRTAGKPVMMIKDFRAPQIMLWPMLLTAVLMLGDVFSILNPGPAGPLIWNTGLIMMFVYAVQGIGILRSVYFRYGVPRGMQMMLEMMLMILLFVPKVNYIVVLGLPVLGISETWINFRKI